MALARRAAEGCTPDGRPLYAAHADLDWPESLPLQLFHAITLLREYRGDGHVAVLVAEGVSGLESAVLHVAQGDAWTREPLRKRRGWSTEQWDAAVERLRERGWLDAVRALHRAGRRGPRARRGPHGRAGAARRGSASARTTASACARSCGRCRPPWSRRAASASSRRARQGAQRSTILPTWALDSSTAVRLRGVVERQHAVDDRPHLAGLDRRPDVLADRRDDRRLLRGRPRAQRGRVHRARAWPSSAPRSSSPVTPPCRPMTTSRPPTASTSTLRGEVGRAHVVEHDVGAGAAGHLADHLDEVLLAVADRALRAELDGARGLLGRADRAQHPRAGARGQLHAPSCRCRRCRRARAAPRPACSRGEREDVGPDGAGHLGQRRGLDERQPGGHRQQLAGRAPRPASA